MLNLTKSDLERQASEKAESTAASQSVDGEGVKADQEFLFFSYNLNLSVSADVSGFLIDNQGRKIEYTLARNTKEVLPSEAFDLVVQKKDELKADEYISESDMGNLAEVLGYVDPKAEFNKEENGRDLGVTTLYGIVYESGKPKLVKIYSEGNVLENPKDPNAQVIQKYFVKKINRENNKAARDQYSE